MRAYLDQNILGYIKEGRILGEAPGITWWYSDEHFEEIERGHMEVLLDVLFDIGARNVGRENGSRDAIDPRAAYQQFLTAKSEVPYDSSILGTALAGRLDPGIRKTSEL